MNDDVFVCRCEEITKKEVIEAIKNGATTVNEVKRFTRAGMGLCQGRTCRRTIERIIAQETGKELKDIKPSNYRQPVRSVKMGAFNDK